MEYNQRKEPVVREILDKMFRAQGFLDHPLIRVAPERQRPFDRGGRQRAVRR